jgi:hypothetical protein
MYCHQVHSDILFLFIKWQHPTSPKAGLVPDETKLKYLEQYISNFWVP